MNLTILIPALNEEQTIAGVIKSIPHLSDSQKILVVDDGSTDSTAQIAQNAGAVVVRHSGNKGLGAAFKTGLTRALELHTDILVTIDADGQFDPQEIPKLIEPIKSGQAHLVTGSRFIDPNFIPKNMPWAKKWGNRRIAKFISWATHQRLHDVSCGFRAYSREAMLQLNLFGRFTYTQESILDLAYKGLSIVEIPIHVKYFEDRKSRIAGSLWNYAVRSANIMFLTIKNYRPLKFFGLSGILIFLIGLGFDIFVLNHFFQTGTFTPYKIFGFLGAFLNACGIIIVFIGILADLIDRVRITQEHLLYLEKRRKYDSSENNSST